MEVEAHPAADRDFDVVLFGATSVTGKRTAAYLAGRAEQTAGGSWAAAGRDAGRVATTLAEHDVVAPEIIVADVGDQASLVEMARRARVVLNLVGPYTLYGEPVIKACIEAGTHYVDLTGEIPFVRRMIDAHDAAAVAAGVKIVQVCGFEALPPDLGVLLAVEAADERWEEPIDSIDLELTSQLPPGIPRPSDVLSAGTMLSLAEVGGDPDSKLALDPAALVLDPNRAAAIRAYSPIEVRPRRSAGGAVLAPMAPAAFINPAVIQRTSALLEAESGVVCEPIRYREGFALPGGTASLLPRYLAAGAMSGMQSGIAALAGARKSIKDPVAGFLRKRLPSSGYGPAADRLDWEWQMRIAARTTEGNVLGVRIDAKGHPGYLSTSKLMGEAGLLLAEPGATPERAGCLTPAVAIGTANIERFRLADLNFSVQT